MAPPGDIPQISSGGPAPQQSVNPPPLRDGPSAQGSAAGTRAAALDVAEIRPLDVSGALQILITEVRAALDEVLLAARDMPHAATPPAAPPGDSAPAPVPSAAVIPQQDAAAAPDDGPLAPAPGNSAPLPLDTPEQAAHAVLETLLPLLPAAADPQQLHAAFAAIDSAVQSGTQRALSIVGGWQGSAAAVPDAAQRAVQLLFNALGEHALNGAWQRPEWALFLPRLERWRRRRLRLRRRLTDPDAREGEPADDGRR